MTGQEKGDLGGRGHIRGGILYQYISLIRFESILFFRYQDVNLILTTTIHQSNTI
jgi:hypothetical protein